MLRGGNQWDQDIPIEIGEHNYKVFRLRSYEHLSIDGSQNAQIIEESQEVIIQIYQVKDNKLLHRLRFPQIKHQILTTYVKFSSEYLICCRNLWEPFSAQLYLFNFKINTGKYYFFEKCSINECFYKEDKFYILLCENLNKLYKVDNDFNLNQIAIKKTDKRDQIINLVENANPIISILLRDEKELLFLSNKLKTINKVVFKNQERFGIFGKNEMCGLKANFILMKDMFLIDLEKYSQIIVAQNRNGKRIIDKLLIRLKKDRFCLQTTLQISNSNSLTLCFYLSKFLLFKGL